MSNQSNIVLVDRPRDEALTELTQEQLLRLGELALMK
jgi:hypothetical protein